MVFLLFGTAVTLSAIAAYYAVVGLMSIFAASAIPIAIMGSALEMSKLVVASWLYRNWKTIPILMKTYFTTALIVLMFLTSMGIFGYLSKAHLDMSINTGDISGKIQIINDKINIQKEIIAQARVDMDIINEQIKKYNELGAVSKGAKLREQQQAERAKLLETIETAQAQVTKLSEEVSPLKAEERKIVAEVGPIKYIAALIYGDALTDGLLEDAVRWVIILIVFVFDPLAVLMLMAFNKEHKEWLLNRKKSDGVDLPPAKEEDPLDDVEVKSFFARGKEVARSLDNGTYEPPKEDVTYVKAEEPEAKPEEEQPPKEDWEDRLYFKADVVPEKTEQFLSQVAQIVSEPPLEKKEIIPESPFAAKVEEDFTLNSTEVERATRPNHGRPAKFKR
jgi:hypothetical protein